MRKIIFIFSMSILYMLGYAQTTATNFNCNDCSGTNHDLFTELDAGKVVVLAWVMPCASCIAPSRTAYDAVQSYATSHPGKMVFYLADDFADTPCNTLTTWANTNAMPNSVIFSNDTVDPTDYGAVGMPKIVILAGNDHTVYYNEDNGNNLTGIKPAIDSALIAAGITEENPNSTALNVFFNALTNQVSVACIFNETSPVLIKINDVTGKAIIEKTFDNIVSDKNEFLIDAGKTEEGIYFVTVSQDANTATKKFLIIK